MSVVLTPAAYLALLATLTKGGHRKLGFIIISPIILPLTAIVNRFSNREQGVSQYFSLDKDTFSKVYAGAAKSNGTLRDIIKCVRDSLGVADAFAKILTSDETNESLPVF
jgi:hypothetical protein